MMIEKKKINKKQQLSYENLPATVKESLTEEEKELFLSSEQWPDSLFENLDEFIIKE